MLRERLRTIRYCPPLPFLSILIFFCITPASSQNHRPHLAFERFTVEHGLSHSQVRHVYQDRKGFLWIGADNGLNRYDGYTFKTYRHDPRDTASISDGPIIYIFEDRYGDLWISTYGHGLNRYDPRTNRFKRYANSPEDSLGFGSNIVGAVYEDLDGNLWAGANGVSRYDRQEDRFVRYAGGEPHPRDDWSQTVSFLLEDRDGTFWAGTQCELSIFDKEKRRLHRVFLSPAERRNSDIYVTGHADDGNALWIGTAGSGIYKMDKFSKKLTRYRNNPSDSLSIGNNEITAIHKDQRGMLWVGTWQYGGLNLFDPRAPGTPRFHRFKRELENSASLSENRIFSICEDRSGNIWIATHRGLNKISRTRKFNHFMSGRQISALYMDSKKQTWIGSMGEGVAVLDSNRKTVRTYRHDRRDPTTISGDFIYCFYEDRGGDMWIGTYENGLNKLAHGTNRIMRYRQDPKEVKALNGHVLSVLQDKSGKIWAVTPSGAEKLENGEFVKDSRVSGKIFSDGRGGLWVFDSEGFSRFDSAENMGPRLPYDANMLPPLKWNQIMTVKTDAAGALWLGVIDWGLVKFDGHSKKWKRYSSQNGLAHDFVYTMEIARDGCLWVSTENGLSRFDPRTETFRTFTVEDGLPSNNFYEGKAFVTGEAEMFFGTTNGVVNFFPDDLRPAKGTPNVALTGFYTLHQPFLLPYDPSEIKEVEITYRENVFSFDFAVLDLTNPAKNQYAYRMEGFDKTWIFAGTRRYITYTNLDPGTYTLRVKGANSDGVWSETETNVRLTITPPFWLEWWFLSAVGGLFLGLAVYLYNWRVSRLLEIERTKDEIARDLHDDVASTLSSIALYSTTLGGKLRTSKPETAELVKKIGSLSLEAVDSMSDIVWSLTPRHNTINEVLLHMRDLASQVCTANGIEYTINIHPVKEERQFEANVKKNIYLIFKEALNNMLKHAEATSTSIEIGIRDGWFEMTVADNGKGFVPKDKSDSSLTTSRGHGLRNMEHRAKQIDADLKVYSMPLKGSRIVLRKRMT